MIRMDYASLMVGACPLCTKTQLHTHPIPLPVMRELILFQEELTEEEFEILFGYPEASTPEPPVLTHSDCKRAERRFYTLILLVMVIEVVRWIGGRA